VASDDLQLIRSTLAGDRNAFGELVLRHQDRLYSTLVRMLGSAHDARDVSQDAFLLAYQKLGTFRQESSFYAWLFRIAYHAAVNNRRRVQRTPMPVPGLGESTDLDHPDLSLPEAPIEARESELQLHQALQQLPEDYRAALLLKELEGLPYEEIAELMHCPVGTVRSRIHRARQMLRDRLFRVIEREQK
jgi:RNA polymerase sigma-70 factor (ECF subfamily)